MSTMTLSPVSSRRAVGSRTGSGVADRAGTRRETGSAARLRPEPAARAADDPPAVEPPVPFPDPGPPRRPLELPAEVEPAAEPPLGPRDQPHVAEHGREVRQI